MKATRLLLAAASFAIAAALPASAQELVPYKQFTLPNGLRVVVHEDHNTPKVAVAVWYHVGSMNEPTGKSGFAHLFEHLMFNGSEHHDKEYMPPLQEIGVSGVNGATSLDQTYYYEIVPTGGLERVLWLESDRMGYLAGAITQAKLDEQRKVVQNEKRTRENTPYALMDQREAAALFPIGHPYHHPTIGSMEDLNAASLDDVKGWFAQYYGATNAVVTLSGDVTLDQAKTLMEKYFGSVPAGEPVSRTTAWVPTLDRDKSEVMQDTVPQLAIAWNWAVPGNRAPEAQALQLAAQALGRGKTSRLYQALVQEKQLATYASASYAGYAAAGIFSIDVRLKPGVDRTEAEAVVKQVLAEFLAKGPAPTELARVKASGSADNARAMESIYVKAMALSSGAMFADNPGQYAVDDKHFQALTAAEVRTTASAWLGKPNYKLTVLPFGNPKAIADGADRTKLPPLGPSPALKLPAVQEARLSNGIRVILAERPGTPTIDMTMVFDAGQAAEQHMKRGVGGFTLGLMDEGTVTLTGQQLAERQALLGARIYSTSDVDTTDFMASAMAKSLPETVALWADYIRNPAFRPADLERDRQQHLSGLSQSLVDSDQIAQRTFTNLLYGPDHAYGAALAGRAETLKSITREDLVAFHDSWIRPDNAVIYAAGNTDIATLTAALEKGFGSWKAPARAKGSKAIDAVPAATAPRIVLVDKPGAIQSVIRVGEILPDGSDPRYFEIGAMNDVLGGNFTARLNMNLREAKGWTYGANSYVAEARGPQAFGVATSVQTDKTAEALGEIDKEIRGIHGDKPATQAELDLLSKGEVLSLPGRFETNNAMVGYLQYVNRFGRPYDWITTMPAKYAALRTDAITASAQLLHPDAMTWVIVGDLSKIEAKVRALKLGTVEIWDAEGRKLR
ncbi:M16 family metallopeptidase [Sphingomonas kyeonggiensis]|uniref:Putative Zn-dependent peptidase n=1 Tax=Sphingomonas kyeonggiensis TaxID=1268553 RepID=A0A7W6JSK0_9SPHN|nr:pitrilysin family protein [Sphingomonas kyeonggiensis]MBB4098715.1 putative Zn-dependent peptidase [Sphingomonas kyeonggiensis]